MKTIIAVDANIILSALLGGKSSFILFNPNFIFITSKFTINEVKKYLPKLQKKLGISQKELSSVLDYIPLQIYSRGVYKDKIQKATEFLRKIDKKDIDILALSLKFDSRLWSQDKHFKKIKNRINLLKTEDLI